MGNLAFTGVTTRTWRGTAVTDAAGNATFNLTGFTVPPKVTTALADPTPTGTVTDTTVVTLTASQVVVNVRRSNGVTVLGINVLGAPIPVQGVTVHLHALP